MALYLEGEQTELQAKGAIAFIVMEVGKANKLHFGRNSNPLNMKFDQQVGLLLSSEGDGEPIDPHKLYTYDYKTHEITDIELAIPGYVYTQPLDKSWEDELLPLGTVSETFGESIEQDLMSWQPEVILNVKRSDWLFQGDIKNKYRGYLQSADGHYDTAYTLLEQDLEVLNSCMDELEIEYGYTTPNVEYTLSVLVAVEKLLLEDPNWTKTKLFHPDYVSLEQLSNKTFQIPQHLKKDSVGQLLKAYYRGK